MHYNIIADFGIIYYNESQINTSKLLYIHLSIFLRFRFVFCARLHLVLGTFVLQQILAAL